MQVLLYVLATPLPEQSILPAYWSYMNDWPSAAQRMFFAAFKCVLPVGSVAAQPWQ